MLALVGEPFDPAMLDFHERRRPVGTDPVNDRNIQKPLQAGNSGKWEAEVGRRLLETFEAVAGPMLDACGYRRATEAMPPSRVEQIAERVLRHPPRKAAAMLRNGAGIAEGIERAWLGWRFRLGRLPVPYGRHLIFRRARGAASRIRIRQASPSRFCGGDVAVEGREPALDATAGVWESGQMRSVQNAGRVEQYPALVSSDTP